MEEPNVEVDKPTNWRKYQKQAYAIIDLKAAYSLWVSLIWEVLAK